MRPTRTLLAVGAAVVAALVLTGFGFTWPFVIGWSLLVGAVGMVAQLVVPAEPSWDAPQIPVEPDRRPTEISRMAWALNTHTGLAGQQISRRVREILRQRLQRHGIDPEDPLHRTRMIALLGPDLWERLSGSKTTIIDIERALDVIDTMPLTPSADLERPGDGPSSDISRTSPFRRTRR